MHNARLSGGLLNAVFLKNPVFILLLLGLLFLQSCGKGSNVIQSDVTLSGTVSYEDKLYDQNGFYGSRFRPVRLAYVDAIDVNDNVLATQNTDETGHFTFTDIPANVDHLSIRTEATIGQGEINIHDINGDLYAASFSLTDQDLAENLLIEISSDHATGGAFNMLDVFSYAMEFSTSYSPSDQTFQPFNVYWRKNNSSLGTYFCDSYEVSQCPQGEGLYVLGGGSFIADTDEYDDDVLLHEFGHYLENNFETFESPGGFHTFTDNTLDLRLSWSEGWANYISVSVKSWLRDNNPAVLSLSPSIEVNTYIDTSDGAGIYFDFVEPDLGLCSVGDCYIYASNEVAVTSILLNISQQSDGEQLIWDSVTGDLPRLITPVNLEGLWDSLNLRNTLIDQNKILNIFLNRQVNYYEDNLEIDGDDSINANLRLIDCANAGICVDNESHTLYKNTSDMDKDFIALNLQNGVQYNIETSRLTNGADTYLRLYASDGNLLAEDDDRDTQPFNCSSQSCPNDGVNFSSQILFTPSDSGTFYLSVSVPDSIYTNGYNMVGKYGSYDLTIQPVN